MSRRSPAAPQGPGGRLRKEVFILASRRPRRPGDLALSRESGSASGLVAKRVFHARRRAPGQPPSCASALTTHLALLAKLCLHRCDECRRGPQPYLHQLALQHGQAPTRACWRHEATLAARHGRACPRNRSLQVVTRAKIKRGDVITQRRAGLAGRARRIDGAGARS